MPTYAKPHNGPTVSNRMTPERAMKSAMLVIGWPEAVTWPKLKRDRDFAAQIFRSALDTRPRDEWVAIDLLELARYSKMMVQVSRAQDAMADLDVGTRTHTAALKAVGQMSTVVHNIGRKLQLHKLTDTPRNTAHQAAKERQVRQTIEGQAEQVAATKSRPRLIA